MSYTVQIHQRFNYQKHIIASPFRRAARNNYADNLGSFYALKKVSQHPSFHRHPWYWWYWNDRPRHLGFIQVSCREHKRRELVPAASYTDDLRIWYQRGLHPKFSVLAALIKAKQPYFNIRTRLMNGGEGDPAIRIPTWILKQANTQQQFLKLMHPFLVTSFYNQGRKYTVTNDFKKKFDDESFTTQDFLKERNQERRRLMLRRGLVIKDVTSKLKLMSSDSEGKLYRERHGNRRYLYVVCPSTKQEYLLGVPQWRNGWGTAEIRTPKQARRWTFNLPDDAQFVQEA